MGSSYERVFFLTGGIMSAFKKAVIVYAVVFIISWFGMVGLSFTGWFLQHLFYNAGWLSPVGSIAVGCCILFILTIPVGLIGVCVVFILTIPVGICGILWWAFTGNRENL